ncbi:MAG TPA: class I SAM-dependent methyltransferase [Lysobacter sp.]
MSEDRYRAGNLDESSRLEFFHSGERHVDHITRALRSTSDPAFVPRRVLDFGCGVGRLVVPFARVADHVTGIDVSAAMVAEADANCRKAGVGNVRLLQAGDSSGLRDEFDLVHSSIVLQHVPWRRGRELVRSLADRVAPGGYLAVQILSACRASGARRALAKACYRVPPLRWLRNAWRGHPVFEPAMQMHVYDVDAIREDLRVLNFETPEFAPVKNVADFDSVFVIARRMAARDRMGTAPSAPQEAEG